MPAIAARSAEFQPAFYWHLGDLRAIYKIDEDMAAAAEKKHEALTCDNYQRGAWDDFVMNQIAPFGDTPFYVGIGNHEVIPPKNEDAFKRHFFDWLNLPALQHQRQLDAEPLQPEPYYHWIQGGIDFIYLDNATGFFSDDQQTWLVRRLHSAITDPEVKSLVVGMHEALPDSLANYHSMGDNSDEPRARPSGENAYKALVAFHDKSKKRVYLLASHSHFFMDHIFDKSPLTRTGSEALPGWIVGTGGAVRYELPKDYSPAKAVANTYGYLLATVGADGEIHFDFKDVTEEQVPHSVKHRYPEDFVAWCFKHNSQITDGKPKEVTCAGANHTH